MSDLSEWMRDLLGRFGRPQGATSSRSADPNIDLLDARMTNVERSITEGEARLKILEDQGNPRGIGRE